VPLPKTNAHPARTQIQRVTPQVDCGRYAVKRTVGDRVDVTARVFRDGYELLGAAVRYKPAGATRWHEAPLELLGNDEWAGSFEVDRAGTWCYRVEAWVDRVASFQHELRRKVDAGQKDLTGELAEGALLLGVEKPHGRGRALGACGRPRGEDLVADVRRRRRSAARPLRLLVRALPTFVGRLRRRARSAPAARRARLRRRLPAADPPDRPLE